MTWATLAEAPPETWAALTHVRAVLRANVAWGGGSVTHEALEDDPVRVAYDGELPAFGYRDVLYRWDDEHAVCFEDRNHVHVAYRLSGIVYAVRTELGTAPVALLLRPLTPGAEWN